jgi:hypothetical protein
MSLALADTAQLDFDALYTHLVGHRKGYRCMHMREACKRGGRRDLRYLHAMRATEGRDDEIEGVISGPGLLWHYKLMRVHGRTQLVVLREDGPPRALQRMGQRFTREILKRIRQEQNAKRGPVRYTTGQYYLRRAQPGFAATHPLCARAVTERVVDPLLVSKLELWQLKLHHP